MKKIIYSVLAMLLIPFFAITWANAQETTEPSEQRAVEYVENNHLGAEVVSVEEAIGASGNEGYEIEWENPLGIAKRSIVTFDQKGGVLYSPVKK